MSNDVHFLVLRHGNSQSRNTFDVSDYDQSLLASDLQSLGYAVSIRRSVGGGIENEGVHHLSHSFLRCSPPGTTEVFIVDLKFKDQFDIMYPTPTYRHVLERIPTLFVAAESKIEPIVEVKL